MENFIYSIVLLIYMEINYKELYQRWVQGERDAFLANSVKITVSILYANWEKLGLLKKVKIPDEIWEKYYHEYLENNSTVLSIAKKLNVTSSTVYNNFKKFGYRRKELKRIDSHSLLEEHKNGATPKALAIKYKVTQQHVRKLIREKS